MEESDRRAAFINSYRQHRQGWTRSNVADVSTNSVNSTTSSLWSCNNMSSMTSELSAEGCHENLPDEESNLSIRASRAERNNVTFVIDPPEVSRSYLTSSSSIMSSSPFSNDMMTSSQDNGPSSDISTPENTQKTFPMALKSESKLIVRKSSDDDDVDLTHRRTARSKKKLSPRRLTPRRSPRKQSTLTCFSSPYPSSVTSSVGQCSTCESSSDDDKIDFLKLNLADDVFNHNMINHLKKEGDGTSGISIIVQDDDDVNGGQTKGVDKLKMEGCAKDFASPRFFPSTSTENKIALNVSGKVFEIDADILDKHPDTMLGNPRKRSRYFDEKRKEYFLDRHRATFEVVLEYYNNGGVLCRPDDIPIDIFINELKFYSFDRETLENFLREEGILHVETKKELPNGKWRKKIWGLFEDHDGSCASQVVTILSAIVIIISVVVFCLETLDEFKSLSHNMTHQFPLALNNCQQEVINKSRKQASYSTLKTPDGLRREVYNFHKLDNDTSLVPVLSVFPVSYLTKSLKDLLNSCQNSVRSLKNKYVFARCLAELEDKNNKLKTVFDDINLFLPSTTLGKYDSTTFSSSSRYSLNNNTMLEIDPSTENDVEESFTDTILNSFQKQTTITRNISDLFRVNAVTDPQGALFAKQACLNLDKFSTTTPYEWLVLEGLMRSPAGILFLTETACICWFVMELALRFLSSPNKKKFVKSFLNTIDFLAILPYFITLIVTTIETKTHVRPQTATILRTIRLVRMLRILKLSRYSRGFRILGLTLVRSTRVLFLLVCFQVVLAVLFSSIAYFMEYDDPKTKFHSIPETFWWALITMTTVGYGDVYPITIWGKLAGACCAIMGILCISFPVPVVVSNFNYLYHLDKDKFKLAPEDLMEEDEEDRGENFEKFRENLFQEMRRSVSGTNEESKAQHNPAELWNIARKNYRKMSQATIDARLEKSPSRSLSISQPPSSKQSTIQGKRRETRGTSV